MGIKRFNNLKKNDDLYIFVNDENFDFFNFF